MTSKRILSIDIFRGLTIFLMVFVNDLASVTGLPRWMGHAKADENWMTFVDVVFPAFLIIVGMSIPLAMGRRLQEGQAPMQIAKHIFSRTFSLLVLGVFMVNSGEMNEASNLLPPWLWRSLLYISAILIWNVYPKFEGKRKPIYLVLQLIGVVILGILAFSFRKGVNGELGITPSWWGILGLIGWAYLLSVGMYTLTRGSSRAIIVGLCLFLLISIGLQLAPKDWGWIKGQYGHFAHASLCVIGILLTKLLHTQTSVRNRILWMLLSAILFLIAGFLLAPYFGISKIYATPSWILYSAASCCVLFAGLYWLVDVKEISQWANFLHPAGINPLLTYILPPLFYALIGLSFLPSFLHTGGWGLVRSLVFSLFILGIAALMTRRNIRLRL